MSTGVQPTDGVQTRRERQREATYDEITRTSRELLAEGAELSLRAVAGRMGMTAPALYRYVSNYQELVDLVAFEIDKAATERFAAAADGLPEDDYAGRLVASVTEFRMWALTNMREFSLAFANPIADAQCVRRDLLTSYNSGHLMTGQMRALWEHNHRAQAFYRKWDFVEAGTHIFNLGDDPQRDLLMSRSLFPPSSI